MAGEIIPDSRATSPGIRNLAARDVRLGWPWTFADHRSMAEVMADEAGTKTA